MAIYSSARLELLPENRSQPKIIPIQVIVHTAADAPGKTRLWKYFGQAKVKVESHFFIHTDGEIVQMMDTERRADANLYANVRAISIETEDDGRPLDPWTPAQLASLVKLSKWINRVHGIPFRLCPTPVAAGFGWHSMFNFPDDRIGQTGRWVPSPWTKVRRKICPGPTRIRQFVNVVMPALSSSQPFEDETAVTEEQVEDLQRLLNKHFGAGLTVDGDYGKLTAAAKQKALRSNPAQPDPKAAEVVQILRGVVANIRRLIQLVG